MSILTNLKKYGRFTWGLRRFLRQRISLEEAQAIVQRRIKEREANFLHLVERGIFGYPRSPYLPLLKLAGCELGDIQKMVRSRGLEETLGALRKAGVYISFEEFKGRCPIVRGGHVIPVETQDFDNPYLSYYYEAESGGTTGKGTRVAIDLDHLASLTPLIMLTHDAHGVLGAPTVIWRGILPDPTGLNNILNSARFGQVPEKWFSPVAAKDLRFSLKNRLATRSIITMGRLFGTALPHPELVRLDEAPVIAHWAAKTLKAHGVCLVRTHVSKAVRICLAAWEEGLDLTGATFMGGGEPPTPAKVRMITRSGARYVPTYFFTEAGAIGLGCARPVDGNDLHFMRGSLALISYPREIPGVGITVNAFCFTSLLPTAPKLLLNVESDDYGLIEERSCGCPLETCGFTHHLRQVRSFSKLTGEGVTLVGSEMVRILEEVLPDRFGGSPLDYQWLEEEDEKGFTRLSLLVDPKINIREERKLIETVLEALRQSNMQTDMTGALWSQAGTLRVKRREPIWTARGKLMPLHVVRASEH